MDKVRRKVIDSMGDEDFEKLRVSLEALSLYGTSPDEIGAAVVGKRPPWRHSRDWYGYWQEVAYTLAKACGGGGK